MSYVKMHLLIRIIKLIKGNDSGGHCAKLKPISLQMGEKEWENSKDSGRRRIT